MASRTAADERLHLKNARNGDKAAFRHLMESSQDRVFGLVYSMVSSREQAEDLIQEIYVKAYFALQDFEGQSSFYTWLYRIASNHCLDFLRKRRPDQISIDKPLSDNSDMTFEDTLVAPASESPEAPLESPSEAAALLGLLEPEQRLILTLREVDGHSYEDMAEILKCPVNTVKSRLNRAREALKDAYTRLHGNIPDDNIVLESKDQS